MGEDKTLIFLLIFSGIAGIIIGTALFVMGGPPNMRGYLVPVIIIVISFIVLIVSLGLYLDKKWGKKGYYYLLIFVGIGLLLLFLYVIYSIIIGTLDIPINPSYYIGITIIIILGLYLIYYGCSKLKLITRKKRKKR